MLRSPVLLDPQAKTGIAERQSFLDAWPSLRDEPIYVLLGVQGSGTNLLSTILERVFGISITRDRSLICSAAVRIARRRTHKAAMREMQNVYRSFFPGPLRRRLLPRAYYHQASNYMGVDALLGRVSIDSPASFANFWYSYHALNNKCVKKGVKSDDVWRHTAHFDTIFPNRRMIRLLRDPRDNAMSISRKDWGPCNLLCAADFVIHQAHIYDAAVAARPDQSLAIKYEELLLEPSAFVERFAERFSIELSDGWTDRLQQIGIRSANRQKWRPLPSATLQHLENRLNDLLDAHGYERATSPDVSPSLANVLICHLDDVFRRVPQKMAKVWRRRILAR